ncbi:hypothetical protein H0H92_000080 [Tricholoma furcatifolium]|nr:hypothetical protein H0H92_000080 [Tricholoma furcatifolium]
MSEWMDVKSEGSAPQFLPSDTPGIESGVYLPPAESHVTSDPQSVSLPPDPEHVFSGRPTTAPSERQRTVQACDKCRERKTKCSGEHPVCQRCTTRGLICQYSSREPRTRGPAKARLRNAISSADLRTSPHPRAYSHGPQPPQHLRHYSSQTLSDYRSLRRVSSIPTTLRADESNELSLNPPTFETYPSFAVEEPPLQFQPGDPRTSQLRDMRRVQSHSTLVGSRGGNLRTTLSHPSFRSTHEFPGQMTYGQQWTSQGGTPSPSMPMFEPSYDRLLPPGGRADQNTQLRPSPKVHPWGHRSNDSTG